MKLIREGRFGKQKQFKTGAVIGSYPKPLLALCLDEGGLDVIPRKGDSIRKDNLPLDCVYEDIHWIKNVTELKELCNTPRDKLPKICAYDLFSCRSQPMSESYKPVANPSGLVEFVDIMKELEAVKDNYPWATNVLDPITGFTEMTHMHIAKVNQKAMEDARKWASDIGYQVIKTVGAFSRLNAHAVFIMHSTVRENELNKEISEVPMIPSAWARDRIGGMLQQFLYATKENGKPVIKTTDTGIVRGIGVRWPMNLPGTVDPMYKDIYERK